MNSADVSESMVRPIEVMVAYSVMKFDMCRTSSVCRGDWRDVLLTRPRRVLARLQTV